MSKIPSLKKDLIIGLYTTCLTEGLSENSLIILTAAGVIIGKPVAKSEVESIEEKITLSSITTMFTDQYKTDFSVESPMPGDEGYIVLKDVKLRTSTNSTFNFHELIIFFDEIIGASLGSNPAEVDA